MKRIITIILTCIMMLSAFNIYAIDKDCVFETGADGKQYWYENNQIQGTDKDPGCVMGDGTCRGREIYDSKTNGWYWLDSIYNGAKAESKEVWMPYIYQDEATYTPEQIDILANDSNTYTEEDYIANMGEQVKKAILNKSGKWVRYDSKGKMVKGWYTVKGKDKNIYPDQKGNTYFYDFQTGLMAKGETIINGKKYFFDPQTGVLQGVWVVKKATTVSSDGSTAITDFEYDTRGNLIEEKSPSYIDKYEYDEDGNVLKSYTKFDNGNEYFETHQYDENGNEIRRETTQIYDGSNTTYITTHEYDSNDVLIKTIVNTNYATGSSSTETTTYIYDLNGRLIKTTWLFEPTVDSSSNSETTYAYDDRGNIIKESYVYSYGYSEEVIYEYNSINKVTKNIWDSSNQGVYFENYREYDPSGLLIKTSTKYNHNAYEYAYEYDSNGNRIKSIRKYDSNTHTTTYEYIYITF